MESHFHPQAHASHDVTVPSIHSQLPPHSTPLAYIQKEFCGQTHLGFLLTTSQMQKLSSETIAWLSYTPWKGFWKKRLHPPYTVAILYFIGMQGSTSPRSSLLLIWMFVNLCPSTKFLQWAAPRKRYSLRVPPQSSALCLISTPRWKLDIGSCLLW